MGPETDIVEPVLSGRLGFWDVCPGHPETQPGPAPQYLSLGPYGPSTDNNHLTETDNCRLII